MRPQWDNRDCEPSRDMLAERGATQTVVASAGVTWLPPAVFGEKRGGTVVPILRQHEPEAALRDIADVRRGRAQPKAAALKIAEPARAPWVRSHPCRSNSGQAISPPKG